MSEPILETIDDGTDPRVGTHKYQPIVLGSESTVVSEYIPDPTRETKYQSEGELETSFIDILREQAYEYLPITSEEQLVQNLRIQLETLNKIEFSDSEWESFFTTCIAGDKDGIREKAARIQEDHVQLLRRDDGTTKNIWLIDKNNVHNNKLQVINQYEVEGVRSNRYDVTILVNGLPLVHIELKRRGVNIREAFNQINRYQRDTFWSGSGLFEYVQIFVISNGTQTKYYSNTTRDQHLASQKSSRKKSSHSFEYTSWWADANNTTIRDLTSFTKTFFAKHTILNILTKYCVFTSDQTLLVMRPYQIVATESILRRIDTSTNYKKLGTIEAGGYIWHTTGSGKTLTSFKSAQLASRMESVDKVLFVVDRKDLDYQTMREYDTFEKGAANSNTSTRILTKQMADPNARIIITTIQKLSKFIAGNKGHEVFDGHIVIIFDECHRSQFGEMHSSITKSFKRYNLFGVTGTPIFAANSGGGNPQLRTTEQAFGDKLHTYTIVDAINDRNVLPFRLDFVNTMKVASGVADQKVRAIDTERALMAPERISKVVSYILDHFDQKTKRASGYEHSVVRNVGDVVSSRRAVEEIRERQRVSGFNSIFATASIDAAKRYYSEFKRQQAERPAPGLRVGIIYSYAPNEEEPDGLLGEEEFEVDDLDKSSRDFLEGTIADYNKMFGTNYDTSADKFQNYYKDLSMRLKNREIDLVIVVNMFLTGFDATTLNTLWVDKNLHHHGLIQAFSRTNRILNSVKTFGNIVSFRDLEEETNAAIALFGDKDASGAVLLKPYGDYYGDYEERISELVQRFPLGEEIIGEHNIKDFIMLFGSILKLRNILQSFDEFEGNEILSSRDFQDYQSDYLGYYEASKRDTDADKEIINDDIVFEIELIKQIEVNVDYILMLVKQYNQGNREDKEILGTIDRAVSSSIELRNKKDLIEQFVASLTVDDDVDATWRRFVDERRSIELDMIIESQNLKPEKARQFMANAFRDGALRESGTEATDILPPTSRFSKDDQLAITKRAVLDELQAFFERFYELS